MKRFQVSPKLVAVFNAIDSWLTDNPTSEAVANDLMHALELLVANEIVECRDQHFHFEADGSVLVFEDEAEAVEYGRTKLEKVRASTLKEFVEKVGAEVGLDVKVLLSDNMEEAYDMLMKKPIDPKGKVN